MRHPGSAQLVMLFHIMGYPDCTVRQIADSLYYTDRTVWWYIQRLKQGGYIGWRKEGRRHHYYANPEAELPHPTVRGKLGAIAPAILRR